MKVVGNSQCPIVDTWWQTETGSHLITPLPGATPLKPGSATLPFFGVEPAVLNEKGEELEGEAEGSALPLTLFMLLCMTGKLHHAMCVSDLVSIELHIWELLVPVWEDKLGAYCLAMRDKLSIDLFGHTKGFHTKGFIQRVSYTGFHEQVEGCMHELVNAHKKQHVNT